MSIIPTLHVRDMAEAVTFYTQVLDFDCADREPASGDPAYAILVRDGDELHLSSHGGDGIAGQPVVILVADVDGLFRQFLARGVDPSAKPQSPVHQAPLTQTWGTREVYVDDPSGNTLRFTQR